MIQLVAYSSVEVLEFKRSRDCWRGEVLESSSMLPSWFLICYTFRYVSWDPHHSLSHRDREETKTVMSCTVVLFCIRIAGTRRSPRATSNGNSSGNSNSNTDGDSNSDSNSTCRKNLSCQEVSMTCMQLYGH